MVQLVVNGTKVETQADPGMPLLWFLRYVPNTLLATADEVIE
jgi:aerobic-type carbon monoxide dehydrogenase small subunit (CoxS/CutS family)